MKIVKIVLMGIMCLGSIFSGAAFANEGPPTIAVFPLKGQFTKSGTIGDPQDTIIQIVTDAFVKTKRFNVIERSQLNRIFTEQKFQTTGDVDESTAVEVGKQAGAKTIVVGSYDVTMTQERNRVGNQISIQYPSKLQLNIRVVDVQTGKIKESISVMARAKDSEQSRSYENLKEDAIRKLEREVSNKFPLAGYIIKVLGENEALIDIGKKDGIDEDTVFSAFEYGEDIIHPVTKKVLKGEKKLITEFKVKTIATETSVVKISGDSAKLKVGLLLESKPREAGISESFSNFFNK